LTGTALAEAAASDRLYPPIEPYSVRYMPVGHGHELYVEQSGNPNGEPVVCVHGGPGGGSQPATRRFFDPSYFRIIQFDQRGAGRSRYADPLSRNTTTDLVDDLNRLRVTLEVDRWMIHGGSWGVALALAYARQAIPAVRAMILRGVFLGDKAEIDWLYAEGGASELYPDLWRMLIAPIPPDRRSEAPAAYLALLGSADEAVRLDAVARAARWARALAKPYPSDEREPLEPARSGDERQVDQMRVKFHYFANACFLQPGELLASARDLGGIPATIISGERDAVCRLERAEALAPAWQTARHLIVPGVGHAADHPDLAAAVRQAADSLRTASAEKGRLQ
jgi:proline iminopeptidase